MCRLLFVFTFLCSTSLFSQTLDGVMGVKFGSSPETVKKVVLAKTGAKLFTGRTHEHMLFFEGFTFAGRKVALVAFSFINNQFHTAMIAFKPKNSATIIELYEELKNEINEKYFVTNMDYEEYKYPYEKGDGLAEYAIQADKANFSAYWEFKNLNSESDYINLKISSDLRIDLTYQSGALIKLARDKQKQDNNKDY